jgi:hypothetical protein
MAKKKNYKIEIKELLPEEIKKYKHITFYEPEFDIDTLNEQALNSFYNFTLQSIIIFKKNPYYKGFKKEFIDIIYGK